MRAIVSSATAAVLAIVVAGTPSASAQTEATPQPCARPNVAPTTIRAVVPDMPAIAQQQGISGTVQLIISLDAESHVSGVRVYSSPSAVLNAAAIAAARQSTFQTEIRGCRPIAADYVFSVSFDAGSTPFRYGTANTGQPTITVTTQGIARRPAELAIVTVAIIVRDDSPAAAGARSAAIFEALRTRLHALGIDDDKIRATYTLSNMSRPATATPAPNASSVPYSPYAARQVTISVEPAARAGAVLDAATAAGVTTISALRYDIHDRDGAYREALANGLKDAQARADVIAATAHVRLGPIQNVQNSGTSGLYAYSAMPTYPAGTAMQKLVPAPVEIRADVTVTYLLLKL